MLHSCICSPVAVLTLLFLPVAAVGIQRTGVASGSGVSGAISITVGSSTDANGGAVVVSAGLSTTAGGGAGTGD
jgi:hypothetical protein